MKPLKSFAKTAIFTGFAIALAGTAIAETNLTIESWRSEDADIWNKQIIPAFEKAHPGIKVKFTPMAPTEYNAALNAKLEGGNAGDIIVCRPFDVSLGLYEKGYLEDLTNIEGLANYPEFAKAAWSTDDGKTTFCIPMASVIHGFIYNKEAFAELGVEVPKTEDAFFAILEKFKEDGNYIPLAMGTSDQWEAATMGYTNIGSNYWKGEKGRKNMIAGLEKFTDPQYVAAFETLAKWATYMAEGFESQSYSDSQLQFTLGRAAIYPAGSWEITGFNKDADFEMGAFYPPVKTEGDTCYITDHTDIGIGVNANGKNKEAAMAFINWVTSEEFATIFGNALPGFFPLSNYALELNDPLAQEFLSWRNECQGTIRNYYQILNRGTPALGNELWITSSNVINGTQTPEQAAKQLQDGLDAWYKPAGQ